MTSGEVREKFLKFFENRGHKIVPSSSLVPEGDDSVLFTTAGMQQFKPYYTGAKDAMKDFGNLNTTSSQKCVRTGDIDEVGDDTHLTFFEMLGNFSFGGYWKKEAISYAHEFITKEMGLTIDYVSVFKDDESGIPADEESREIWLSIDPTIKVKDHKKEDNFWGPTGEEGPCGPTTEIYINGVEIWNIVFNEYYKSKDGKFNPLEVKGIDTGMGLERLLVQVEKKNNVYETDLFSDVVDRIDKFSNGVISLKSQRIIADHMRASVFMISDGVLPSNSSKGYILRRLLRRAIFQSNLNKINKQQFLALVDSVEILYRDSRYYLDLSNNNLGTKLTIENEYDKFMKTLESGLKEFDRIFKSLSSNDDKKTFFMGGGDFFRLYETYGFPVELSIEEYVKRRNELGYDPAPEEIRKLWLDEVHKKMEEHQKLSQTSSAGMFKGGLQNHEPKTVKLHTAHHLLLAGLQAIVGKGIKQRGSNINEERLRMDFICDHKLTDEEKKNVEDWVNEKIKKGFKVIRKEMPLAEAEKLGAEMEFGAKYPEVVSVYMIEGSDGEIISKEFCGGPHIAQSEELGTFKIQKEEAVAQGIRRIKAILS